MNKKIFSLVIPVLILILYLILYLSQFSSPNNEARIIFCDVGQGDGIYLDLPNNVDVVIDGGPNNKILECLGKYMPFWDREIEIVVLTHPQADHLNGLIEVMRRYQVKHFVTSPIGNATKGYQELTKVIQEGDTTIQNIYTGDEIKISNITLRTLWPSREYVEDNSSATISANILGATTTNADLNDFSVILQLEYGAFDAVFTGDADENIQDEILAANTKLKPVEIFKIPHHGSRYGLLDEFIDRFEPGFAVISVGKNQWGHPTPELLSRLSLRSIPILRTDNDGDIVVITNGQQYWIESDKN
ncbi:MAG: MBL fold metallo-hydrolase [bacterium]|nr:MBL fold metallo-hydrolase [bacterium]